MLRQCIFFNAPFHDFLNAICSRSAIKPRSCADLSNESLNINKLSATTGLQIVRSAVDFSMHDLGQTAAEQIKYTPKKTEFHAVIPKCNCFGTN